MVRKLKQFKGNGFKEEKLKEKPSILSFKLPKLKARRRPKFILNFMVKPPQTKNRIKNIV